MSSMNMPDIKKLTSNEISKADTYRESYREEQT